MSEENAEEKLKIAKDVIKLQLMHLVDCGRLIDATMTALTQLVGRCHTCVRDNPDKEGDYVVCPECQMLWRQLSPIIKQFQASQDNLKMELLLRGNVVGSA